MKKFLFILFVLLPGNVMADNEVCGDAYYYHAEFEPIVYNCGVNQFLPAGGISCEECPVNHTCLGGTYTFNATQTQGLDDGDILVVDAIGSCVKNFNKSYSAIFEPITYTCAPGYYLPAGGISCEECPVNHTCSGGTYTFNATQTQGLDDGEILVMDAMGSCVKNINKSYSAIFEPITYTCAPGYYLPANMDACTQCPQNNKCVGGTYSFNETINQGIEQCANPTPFAPIGSSVCYPHVLHIGDDVVYLKGTKLTTPSLNVGWGGDVFYANMTTVPTPMNASTERYLKIEYDGMIYYVCDDSTYGQ